MSVVANMVWVLIDASMGVESHSMCVVHSSLHRWERKRNTSKPVDRSNCGDQLESTVVCVNQRDHVVVFDMNSSDMMMEDCTRRGLVAPLFDCVTWTCVLRCFNVRR